MSPSTLNARDRKLTKDSSGKEITKDSKKKEAEKAKKMNVFFSQLGDLYDKVQSHPSAWKSEEFGRT